MPKTKTRHPFTFFAMKKGYPACLGKKNGDELLPRIFSDLLNHEKDPFETTRIQWKVSGRVFSFVAHFNMLPGGEWKQNFERNLAFERVVVSQRFNGFKLFIHLELWEIWCKTHTWFSKWVVIDNHHLDHGEFHGTCKVLSFLVPAGLTSFFVELDLTIPRHPNRCWEGIWTPKYT